MQESRERKPEEALPHGILMRTGGVLFGLGVGGVILSGEHPAAMSVGGFLAVVGLFLLLASVGMLVHHALKRPSDV